MTINSLKSLRIVLVEDETLIALLLEDMLNNLGCTIVGVALSMQDSMRLAESVEADIAILDVSISGQEIFPVAERLTERGITIVFSTGYDATRLPVQWRTSPVLSKPFDLIELETVLRKIVNTI